MIRTAPLQVPTAPNEILIPVMTLTAFVAGFVDAIAGGGGVITYPVFMFFGLPIAQIAGTNKLAGTFGSSASSLAFWRQGKVDRDVILASVGFTAAGAVVGAAAVTIIPNGFLKPIVVVLIIALAVYFFVRPEMGIEGSFERLRRGRMTYLLQGSALVLGFYDGFFGPGVGAFLAFMFIRGLQMDFLHATANTKVLNWISNITSLAYFLTRGNIRFEVGIPMGFANAAGAALGARVAMARGSSFIKWVYLAMAVAIAVRTILA